MQHQNQNICLLPIFLVNINKVHLSHQVTNHHNLQRQYLFHHTINLLNMFKNNILQHNMKLQILLMLFICLRTFCLKFTLPQIIKSQFMLPQLLNTLPQFLLILHQYLHLNHQAIVCTKKHLRLRQDLIQHRQQILVLTDLLLQQLRLHQTIFTQIFNKNKLWRDPYLGSLLFLVSKGNYGN